MLCCFCVFIYPWASSLRTWHWHCWNNYWNATWLNVTVYVTDVTHKTSSVGLCWCYLLTRAKMNIHMKTSMRQPYVSLIQQQHETIDHRWSQIKNVSYCSSNCFICTHLITLIIYYHDQFFFFFSTYTISNTSNCLEDNKALTSRTRK